MALPVTFTSKVVVTGHHHLPQHPHGSLMAHPLFPPHLSSPNSQNAMASLLPAAADRLSHTLARCGSVFPLPAPPLPPWRAESQFPTPACTAERYLVSSKSRPRRPPWSGGLLFKPYSCRPGGSIHFHRWPPFPYLAERSLQLKNFSSTHSGHGHRVPATIVFKTNIYYLINK